MRTNPKTKCDSGT